MLVLYYSSFLVSQSGQIPREDFRIHIAFVVTLLVYA